MLPESWRTGYIQINETKNNRLLNSYMCAKRHRINAVKFFRKNNFPFRISIYQMS